jgi:hypothetical protein
LKLSNAIPLYLHLFISWIHMTYKLFYRHKRMWKWPMCKWSELSRSSKWVSMQLWTGIHGQLVSNWYFYNANIIKPINLSEKCVCVCEESSLKHLIELKTFLLHIFVWFDINQQYIWLIYMIMNIVLYCRHKRMLKWTLWERGYMQRPY